MQRLKKVVITLEYIDAMMTSGASDKTHGWLCANGLPEGARRVNQWTDNSTLTLVYEHRSFAPVYMGDPVPELTPKFVATSEPVLKKPDEWQDDPTVSDYIVVDPDGWRSGCRLGEKSWFEPITKDEYLQRMVSCTVRPRSGR